MKLSLICNKKSPIYKVARKIPIEWSFPHIYCKKISYFRSLLFLPTTFSRLIDPIEKHLF